MRGLFVALFLCLVSFSGCGTTSEPDPIAPGPAASVVGAGGPNPVGESRYLYTYSTLARSVVGYRLEPSTGRLYPVGTARINQPQSTPSAVVVTNHHVYATDSASGAVNAFQVQADGRLTPIHSALGLTGKPDLVGLRATSDGRFIFALSASPAAIYTLTADTTGAITQVGQPVALGTLPNSESPLCVDPQGSYVFVCNDGQVTSLAVGADGSLTKVGNFGSGSSTAVATDRSGAFLYTADVNDNVVSQYTITRSSGALQPMSPATVAAPGGPICIVSDPAGPFLYAGTKSGQAAAFSIGSSGQLATLGVTGQRIDWKSVAHLEIDAAGRALYANVTVSGVLSAVYHFSINSDGSLGQAQPLDSLLNDLGGELHFDNGTQPVVVTPKNVYTANAAGNSVSAFSVDSSTGNLSALNTVSSLSGEPRALAEAKLPNGKRVLYLATFNALSVIYPKDDGSLSEPISLNLGSPSIVSMAVSSSNQFLYVLDSNPGGNSFVVVLDIQPDGTLVPTNSAWDTGAPGGRKIKVDPRGGLVYVAHANHLVPFLEGLLGQLQLQPASTLDPRNAGTTDLELNPRVGAATLALNVLKELETFLHIGQGVVQGDLPVSFDQPRAIAFDPSGTNLYETVDQPPSIRLFRVADDRTLSPVFGSTPVGPIPGSISTDGSGRFLYVVNVGTNSISQFSINPNGTLTSLSPGSVPTGSSPSDLLVVNDRQ